MGRRGHRVGSPNRRTIGLAYPQTGKLSGAKPKARRARAAQTKPTWSPRLHAKHLLASELLGADSHTADLSFVTAVSRKAPRRNTAGSYAYIHYAICPTRARSSARATRRALTGLRCCRRIPAQPLAQPRLAGRESSAAAQRQLRRLGRQLSQPLPGY
jgi:hypothetical protein